MLSPYSLFALYDAKFLKQLSVAAVTQAIYIKTLAKNRRIQKCNVNLRN